MSALSVGYGTDTVSFTNFSGDDLPRSVVDQAALNFSSLGVAYSSGSVRKQRKLWSVAAIGTLAQWNTLSSIFDAWDTERASGSGQALVTVQDTLLGANITSYGFFTANPTLTKLAPGNNTLFIISFGITEV